MENTQTNALMNSSEAASYLRVSLSRIRYEVHLGRIPHIKIGRSVRFEREELLKWIEGHKVAARKAGRGEE